MQVVLTLTHEPLHVDIGLCKSDLDLSPEAFAEAIIVPALASLKRAVKEREAANPN